MKLNPTPLKIKCKVSHLNTLIRYLGHLITNHDVYLEPFVYNSTVRRIYRYHLNTLSEKVAKLIFNYTAHVDLKCTLSITEAERLVLFEVTANYPLPLDINFIEFEIKNGLLK